MKPAVELLDASASRDLKTQRFNFPRKLVGVKFPPKGEALD